MTVKVSELNTWVGLEGLQVHAYHGVHQAERLLGTQFIVDLRVQFRPGDRIRDDRLEDTLDYSLLNEIVLSEMAVPAHLIETVGLRILDRIAEIQAGVRAIELRIRKTNPPLRGQLDASVFIVHWSRDSSI